MGWLQGRSGRLRKISPPPGFDPRAVQLVTSRYTNYAILAYMHVVRDIKTKVSVRNVCPKLSGFMKLRIEGKQMGK
jgi:hypothetical protein